MEREYWQRQTHERPLFPELEWSRPENRLQAGKLLIIGGNGHGFAAPAQAYNEALEAGIGSAHVVLPDALHKIVDESFAAAQFAPSTKISGSFSQRALGEFLALSSWADGILVAGDLGRNSETAILLEKFLAKCPFAITLAGDAIDYVINSPAAVAERLMTLLVPTYVELQRLGQSFKMTSPVTSTMDLLHLVEWLRELTLKFAPYIIVQHDEQVVVAVHGQVSTTPVHKKTNLKLAARAAVWWLQNPSKPFEALTTAII